MSEDKHEQPPLPAPGKGQKTPLPHAGQNPYYPRAAGEDDASAEANARIASDIATRASPPIPAEQLVTAPTSEPLVGGRAMYALVGPYRGQILTMPDAEGESAKDNNWAIDIADMSGPFDANKPYDHDHELTDEDRAYAVKEANEWAQAQYGQGEADDEDEPAPEGETEDQRKQREKRNDERRRQKPDQKPARQPDQKPAHQPGQQPGQQPHPGQHPAQQPAHQSGPGNRGRTVGSPGPAGTYETR